ncbi:PAS domain S-box protein [Marinagarivorans algicola]|uniref:PAS domain S-box protein n=1 Tax=Marinagarivorans algicola TaxID=1513270 RepID=UPI0006B8CDD9|nr:PAS domain S-box protein [Marinagarivorans algicola]
MNQFTVRAIAIFTSLSRYLAERVLISKVAELLLASLLYYCCVSLSIDFAPSASYQSVFWPASGVAVSLLLLRGNIHALSIMLGGLFAYAFSQRLSFNSLVNDPYTPVLLSVFLAHVLLISSLVFVPALQAYLAAKWVRLFCVDSLWVFTRGTQLWRLIIMAGVFPAVICVACLLPALWLYDADDAPLPVFDVVVSLFWGNVCGVAIIVPCVLLVTMPNPRVDFGRKLKIAVPMLGLFLLSAMCYSVLYHQLKVHISFEQKTLLTQSADKLRDRINTVYQQIQTLRFFLMNEQKHVDSLYTTTAKKAFLSQQALNDDLPYFATALLTAQYDDKKITNYYISHTYPVKAFESIKRIPLAHDKRMLYTLQAAAERPRRYALIAINSTLNTDQIMQTTGSPIVLLAHQLFADNRSRLLAAVIDMASLSYEVGLQYTSRYHAFHIDDIDSGQKLFGSGGIERLAALPYTIAFEQDLHVGDRKWRLRAVYDPLWFDYQLQSALLPITILSLILITLFSVFILSALVSAESLEQAVTEHSKALEQERIFLDTVFENIPLFVFVKDVVTRKYLRVNHHVERVLGMHPSAYEGKTAHDFFSPLDAQRRTAEEDQLIAHGGVLEVGEELVDSAIGQRWLYTRKSLILDDQGKARYILGVAEDMTERRKQAQTLNGVIEAMPLSLLVVDSDGVIIYSNQMSQRMMALAIGHTCLKEVLPDCDLDLVTQLLKGESAKNTQPLPIILMANMLGLDARYLPVEVTFSPVMWAGAIRTLVLIADISERIKSQKSLRDSENQLRLLMANLGEGVCGIDTRGCVTYMNLAACTILGYSEAALLHKNFYSTVFTDDGNNDDPIFKACSLGQSTRVGDAYFTHQSGTCLPVEYVCTPLLADQNKNIGAVIVFNNLQERFEQKQRLNQRNELIALGLDASGLGSWEWRRSDNLIRWSTNIYKILDMQEGSFSGEVAGLSEYIHPLDLAEVRLVDELAKQTLEVTEFCCRMLTAFGRVIWVTGKYRYFLDDAERIVRARGVLWDSTDETLLQQDNQEKTEALKRSNKELDDFAHIASHDLKEPLRGISNYATFLQEDYADLLDIDGRHMLHSITRLTHHMECLISDLLSFSRLGKAELAMGSVDIDTLLVDVLESLLPRIEELNVYVSLETPLAALYCDRVRMTEVFRNLITNAMKYNDNTEKHIVITCQQAHNEIIYGIKDNGIGIAQAYQAQIFDMFKRLHGRREYGGGSGIGLSIVQKIITQHGGRLWLESEVLQGAHFYFALPTAPPICPYS